MSTYESCFRPEPGTRHALALEDLLRFRPQQWRKAADEAAPPICSSEDSELRETFLTRPCPLCSLSFCEAVLLWRAALRWPALRSKTLRRHGTFLPPSFRDV